MHKAITRCTKVAIAKLLACSPHTNQQQRCRAWVFKNGVVRLEQPGTEAVVRKALVYVPVGETVASHAALQRRLLELGWERYYEDLALVQFHRCDSVDLISLPADFARLSSMHMHDIVVKNREHFMVVDGAGQEEARPLPAAAGARRKALVYVPADETVASHEALQRRLLELGWERYGESNPTFVQFHRPGSMDLLSLPADFARLGSLHMHAVVVNNREHFKIVDDTGPATGGQQ